MKSRIPGIVTWTAALASLPAAAVLHAAEAGDELVNTGNQNALDPSGLQAAAIGTLWWWMFGVAVVVFVVVIGLLVLGQMQARRAGERHLSWIASRNLVLTAGVAVPLVVLIALVGGSLMLESRLTSAPPPGALTVEVTGWRWWWEIRYLDDEGEPILVTANELHVPVGRPVSLRLTSNDVIHSFWVPELHGKTDLVPGYVNTSWFQATSPGIFRGQCAEFCGTQHSLMAFLVVAQPEQEFNNWLELQRGDARAPRTEEESFGAEVFQGSTCPACHTIRGTGAFGQLGPDLTHFGSRLTLAAATRPNTIGHLGGWIADPQSVKPGNLMPATLLGGEELTALITYLKSLE